MEKETKFLCPLCGKPMVALDDATGVFVICRGPCVPTVHENVFGHGNNEKNAYEIACLKYKKSA